jgi:SHS2 domain-containing protein
MITGVRDELLSSRTQRLVDGRLDLTSLRQKQKLQGELQHPTTFDFCVFFFNEYTYVLSTRNIGYVR